MNWNDNERLPETLNKERLYMLKNDPETYGWVWEGETKKLKNSLIFGGRWKVEEFESPITAIYRYGSDFGFAQDASTCVRCFIKGRKLYIDYDAGGVGVEIDRIGPDIYDKVPGSKRGPIRCDSSRPETISFLKKQGYPTVRVIKGPGSLNDGIAFIKSFEQIVVHPRCTGVISEFKTYRWKVIRLTGEILPIPVDRDNHYCDALRYALEPLMRNRTDITVWARSA
jgi:phage terminase large subunit